MTILICTAATFKDPGIDRVVAEIEARGGHVVRFDTDGFPGDLGLTLRWDAADGRTLSLPAGPLDATSLSSAWIRHMDVGAKLPAGLDPALREASRLQAEAAVWSFLESLPCFVLDRPEALHGTPDKPLQLHRARALGLDIPRTLVTNEPAAVRSLAKECPQGLIAKMIGSGSVSVLTEDGRTTPVYTRALSADDIADLDGLELCPMIFQEQVPKALEIRITVVGHRVFAAAIASAGSERGAADWRRDRELISSFRPFPELPDAVERRLLRLLDAWGLNFATADFILTPDGRFVFLEVNTVSFFDFVEDATGLPISASIAELLLGLAPPRIVGVESRGSTAG